MSADDGSDMAANAWPGFVDILSAVVIMFVFFVLITAAVLYFYTITYKAKVESQVIMEQLENPDSGTASVVSQLQQENLKLREQIEKSEKNSSSGSTAEDTTTQTAVSQTFGEQLNEQALSISNENRSLVLFHDAGSITVDEASEEKITQFIEEMRKTHGADKLEIVMTSPKLAKASTQSQAKKIAVARMLNLRNSLLETTIKQENLQLKVVESEDIEGSTNWTRLQINLLE